MIGTVAIENFAIQRTQDLMLQGTGIDGVFFSTRTENQQEYSQDGEECRMPELYNVPFICPCGGMPPLMFFHGIQILGQFTVSVFRMSIPPVKIKTL